MTIEDMSYCYRRKAARKRSTSHADLVRLARDVNWEIRRDVALNKSAPAEALKGLAKDTEWRVQLAVPSNRTTPEKVLMFLAGSASTEHPKIFKKIVKHQNCTKEIKVIIALRGSTPTLES